jgi:mono/diheme cytochrome c family protein
VVGIALTGLTGLLVRGQAQTELRGHQNDVGAIHFWLGFVLVAVLFGAAAARSRSTWAAVAAITLIAGVTVQGYLGGRMTYEHGVGVQDAGAFAQSARGAADLELALAKGTAPAQAGEMAYSADELGCAACHGDRAQGGRGPALGGGRRLEEFRRVHGNGLFPAKIVSDGDFAAIVAYLQTLPRRGED